MRFFRLLFLIALFLVFFTPGVSDAQILCRSSVGGHCVNLAAAGSIPGLEFLGEIATPSDLFSKIYTFGVSFVGLAAFFMFTYGAVRYMMAGEGSPSEAKKIMYNALIGLVLALVSYLILNIINPDLVKGFNIGLPPIPELKTSNPGPIYAPTGATTWWECRLNPSDPGSRVTQDKYGSEGSCKPKCSAQCTSITP